MCYVSQIPGPPVRGLVAFDLGKAWHPALSHSPSSQPQRGTERGTHSPMDGARPESVCTDLKTHTHIRLTLYTANLKSGPEHKTPVPLPGYAKPSRKWTSQTEIPATHCIAITANIYRASPMCHPLFKVHYACLKRG